VILKRARGCRERSTSPQETFSIAGRDYALVKNR
jgi:hypothetical protein